jgi:hypothetical protein
MSDRGLAAKRLLAVTEEELQRIVLDIHDGPVQNLFAALSQLTLLRARISNLQPPADECMAAINRAINLLEISLGEAGCPVGTGSFANWIACLLFSKRCFGVPRSRVWTGLP